MNGTRTRSGHATQGTFLEASHRSCRYGGTAEPEPGLVVGEGGGGGSSITTSDCSSTSSLPPDVNSTCAEAPRPVLSASCANSPMPVLAPVQASPPHGGGRPDRPSPTALRSRPLLRPVSDFWSSRRPARRNPKRSAQSTPACPEIVSNQEGGHTVVRLDRPSFLNKTGAVRGSLRLQFFSALVLPPIIVAAVLTTVGIRLFRQDKELYVYDSFAQIVDLIARDLSSKLDVLKVRAELSRNTTPRLLEVRAIPVGNRPRSTLISLDNVSHGGQPRLRVRYPGLAEDLEVDCRPRGPA